MAMKIKWGVIGSGGIARRRTIPEGIVPAENASLEVVFDTNKEVNAEVAREFEAGAAESVGALLQADIEAVYIASPVYCHAEHALAAIRSGKHVLLEKPMGLNVAEAEHIVRASREAGVKLGCAFMMRFIRQHEEALKIIQAGRLGRPTYARAQLSCWYPPIENAWRQDPSLGGGGSLIDMGGHCIDLLEMFFGKVKEVVCLTGRTVHSYAAEDSAAVLLSFENGALGTVDTFFCIPDACSRNALELYGSQGSVLAEGTIGQLPAGRMTAYLEEPVQGYDAMQTRQASEPRAIAPEARNPYQSEIEEFSQAVIDGREPGIGAEVGLRSQRILAACYESARTRKVQSIF